MWDVFVGAFINVLLFIYQVVGNFGVAIILFTILIRLITHPLTASQLKGAQAMQDLQKDPRWLDMQAKYKNDKEKLAQEQMKLYQELKINPLASCLPTLIQFPIIIALYQAVIRALASTPIELLNLTKAVYPSLLKVSTLIPLNSHFLWMDLGQPERLPVPFLTAIPFLAGGIPILAIVVMASTYVQSKLMTPPSAGGAGDQTAMMSNMMNLYMPFLMGYLALTLASGLSLYFLVSNLVGILQYALLGRVNWSNLNPFQKQAVPAPRPSSSGSKSSRPSTPAPSSKPSRPAQLESENARSSKPARIESRTDGPKKANEKPYRTGKPGKIAKSGGSSSSKADPSADRSQDDSSSDPSNKPQNPARPVKSK
jgi:YidC/Oxa1 family membrane protein insertase